MPHDSHSNGATNGVAHKAPAGASAYAGLLQVFLNAERELKLFQ